MLLARRDLTVAKGRFLLMGAAVALVALLGVLLAGLAAGLVDDGTSGLARLPVTHLGFQPGSGSTFSRSFVPADSVEQLRGSGVRRVAPLGVSLLNARQERPGRRTRVVDLALFGVERESFLAPTPTAGSGLGGSGPAPVVISQQLADEGVRPGDRLLGGLDATPLTVVGVADVGAYGHVPVAYTDLPTWQQVTPGATTPSGRGLVAAAALQLDDGADPAAVGERADVEVVTRTGSFDGSPGYAAETATTNLVRAFLLVVSALVVAAFFATWTLQRRRQVGLLKAMGASDRYVLRDALFTAAVLVVGATVAGTVAGLVAATFVPEEVPFSLRPGAVLAAAGALVVAGLLGAATSLRRITSVDPLLAVQGAQ